MNESMSLGEVLRAARQKCRLSVSQIAETTRLKATMIEDLERDDFSHVPAPIYGRGFLRMYAEAVGLNPQPLIEEYMRVCAASRPAANVAELAPAAHARRPVTRSMRRHNWLSLWNTFCRNLEQLSADLIDRTRARRTAAAYQVRTHRSFAERMEGIPWAAIVVVAAVVVLVVFIVLGIGNLFTTASKTRPVAALNMTPARALPIVPLRLAAEPPAPYLPSAPSAPVAR
ncbi:MAG: helix-turn-helix transcriptional regulator [bacterium]